MRQIFFIILLVVITCFWIDAGWTQETEKKSLLERLTLGGYIQQQYEYISSEEVDVTSSFHLRRARLSFASVINTDLNTYIEIDLANTTHVLKDAYFIMQVFPSVFLKAGQFKMPFSRTRLRSGNDLLMIERGSVVENFENSFYLGRDVGAMLSYQTRRELFSINLGYFNGSGINRGRDDNSGKSIAARLQFRPNPLLNVAANVNMNSRPVPGDPEKSESKMAMGIDFAITLKSILIEGEHLQGDNWLLGEKIKMKGMVLTAQYTRLKRFYNFPSQAILLQYEMFDPNDQLENDSFINLVPGIKLDIYNKSRFQIDVKYTIYQNEELDPTLSFLAQLQVNF